MQPLVTAVASGSTSVLAFTRNFLATRRGNEALVRGSIAFPEVPSPLLAILRKSGRQEVLCLFNLGDQPQDMAPGLVGGFSMLINSGADAEPPARLAGHALWIGQRET